ncbi:hypothetical protein J6590_049110 [Homalodisca vitripennis]|nr:hypothetical protein J6590_049110 [Homalodisca vitripennis]
MSGNLDESDIDMFLDEPMSSERDRYGGNYGELENYSGSEFPDLKVIGDFITVDSVFSTDYEDAMAENENAVFDDELKIGLDGNSDMTNSSVCVNKNSGNENAGLNEDSINDLNEIEEALDIEEGRRSRKNCKICYNKAMREGGRQVYKNLKKVTTFFELCPGKPYLPKNCFKKIHK